MKAITTTLSLLLLTSCTQLPARYCADVYVDQKKEECYKTYTTNSPTGGFIVERIQAAPTLYKVTFEDGDFLIGSSVTASVIQY